MFVRLFNVKSKVNKEIVNLIKMDSANIIEITTYHKHIDPASGNRLIIIAYEFNKTKQFKKFQYTEIDWQYIEYYLF